MKRHHVWLADSAPGNRWQAGGFTIFQEYVCIYIYIYMYINIYIYVYNMYIIIYNIYIIIYVYLMCVWLCVCASHMWLKLTVWNHQAYFRYSNPSDFWMEMTYMTCLSWHSHGIALELLWSMLLKRRLETLGALHSSIGSVFDLLSWARYHLSKSLIGRVVVWKKKTNFDPYHNLFSSILITISGEMNNSCWWNPRVVFYIVDVTSFIETVFWK